MQNLRLKKAFLGDFRAKMKSLHPKFATVCRNVCDANEVTCYQSNADCKTNTIQVQIMITCKVSIATAVKCSLQSTENAQISDVNMSKIFIKLYFIKDN